MLPQAHTAAAPRRFNRWFWLVPICFGLAWLQMTLAGYELGVGNQAIQVPFLLRLHSAALFTHDAMVTTTLTVYPSLFYRVLAPFLAILPLPVLYYGLHLLTTAGVFLAVIALSWVLFRSRGATVVLVGCWLAGHHHALAEQLLYSTGFTHTWAVFPLTLAALALLYADQPLAAFALTGVAVNFHALEAGQLALVMVFWAIFTLRLRQVTGLLLVFIVLAAPTLVPMLLTRQTFDAGWLQLMHLRSGHHSFPFTWWRPGQPDIPQFLLILALAGVALTLVPGPHLRKTGLLTAGVGLLFVVGILFTEVWPNAFIIRAQLFRSSRLLLVLALAYLAAGCARARGSERLGAVLSVACLAVPPWLGLLPLALVVTTVLALVNRRLLWQQALLVGVALLVALVAWRTIDFVPISWAWNFHRPEPGTEPAWRAAQDWARIHTPDDAVFLTPAQQNGFRVHSQRAIVGEWRDGTQLYFSTAFAQPWWERMQALQPGLRVAPDGQRLLVQGRSISQLPDAQIIALAKQFNAGYAVLAAEVPRRLVEVYRNAKWAIYRPELVVEPPTSQTDVQRFLKEVALPNIDRYRKSPVRLQIVDAAGRPLYDARYRVTEKRSAFLFGGSNYTVLTNAAWWCNIEPVNGQRQYADLERALSVDSMIEFSFLTGFSPAWLRVLSEGDQAARLRQHATDLVDCYAARVDFWEITDQSLAMNQVSNLVVALRGKYPGLKIGLSVATRFDTAGSPLGLDDVQQLKAVGFDFVAIHGHEPWGVWADPQVLYAIFDAFAKEGVRIHITQLAAPSTGWIEGTLRHGQWTPELQAEYCRQFITVAFSHPAVDAINPVDEPWRTELAGTLPLDGVLTFRGFHGGYEIEVLPPAGPAAVASFAVRPGTNNNYRLQLTAPGQLVSGK